MRNAKESIAKVVNSLFSTKPNISTYIDGRNGFMAIIVFFLCIVCMYVHKHLLTDPIYISLLQLNKSAQAENISLELIKTNSICCCVQSCIMKHLSNASYD